jgi:RecB family exonuclease
VSKVYVDTGKHVRGLIPQEPAMLTIVCSPLPSIPSEPASLPREVSDLLERLEQRPQRCQWIVPTGRRRRALLHDWLRTEDRSASLLPGLHTIKSFAAQVLEYSPRQLPQISGPERLLRVARAWQEVMGRAPGGGLVRQLDRFIRDWQACNLDIPSKPANIFERLVQRYWNDLESDHRLDQVSSLRVLVREVSDPDSWPNRLFLNRMDLLLFDGFHRLERLELELIAALSRRCDVVAWLVGVPGQLSGGLLESTVRRLTGKGIEALVVEHAPAATSPFTNLGRSLFPVQPVRSARSEPLPGLFRLEAANSTVEVEAVAKRIKADYLASQATGRPLRLSDVAVVIPGPDYDPLVREIFPRAGLEFNLAGQALRVSASRPARVLTAALQLIHGHWRNDLLLDFLNLPLIKRCLAEAHRLHDLFEHRPRARRQLDYQVWEEAWDRHVQKLRARIDRWKSGELDLPEQIILSREEFLAKQGELAHSLEQLIESIKGVLKPVAAIAAMVGGAASLEAVVASCVELLRLLEIDQWLTPHRQEREHGERQYGVAVPWVEYEKDQKAYYKLVGILQALPAVPRNRLPLTPQGQPDVLGALRLALDSETYQIKTEDDAGVQLFELRELRGLRFRHVYVLGLVDGKIPQVPEEGLLAGRRRFIPALAEQLQQKETEVFYLFSQLFEAAEERLVLACPTVDGAQKTMPSRFLRAVEEQVPLAPLEPADLTASLHEAAKQLGCAARGGQARGKTLVDLWPRAASQRATDLELLVAGLASWQRRECWTGQIRIEVAPLLQIPFPDARVFSPSELETYAACPFRYFGSRVLKLEERDPDRTRWYYGSLMHRVFQAFYTERRRLLSVRDDEPLPAVDLRSQARLVELFEAEWAQLDDGSLPPDLKNLFACEEGVLHLFFDAIAAIEAEHGNLLNEFILQDAKGEPILLGEDKKNRPVLLTGKIDRVDVHRTERTRAIILDYKTGRSKPPKERAAKMEDGRMLQLPLYAAALQRVRTELQIVGGAYIHLSEKLADAKKAIAAAGELTSSGRRSPPVPFEAEAARRLALQLVGDIRDGNFSWTPHTLDRPHTECTSYCEMKHACRHPDGYQAVERY